MSDYDPCVRIDMWHVAMEHAATMPIFTRKDLLAVCEDAVDAPKWWGRVEWRMIIEQVTQYIEAKGLVDVERLETGGKPKQYTWREFGAMKCLWCKR